MQYDPGYVTRQAESLKAHQSVRFFCNRRASNPFWASFQKESETPSGLKVSDKVRLLLIPPIGGPFQRAAQPRRRQSVL